MKLTFTKGLLFGLAAGLGCMIAQGESYARRFADSLQDVREIKAKCDERVARWEELANHYENELNKREDELLKRLAKSSAAKFSR